MKRLVILSALLLPALASHAALNLEGQSGVFLNTLAYAAPPSTTEFSNHQVNLDSLGAVSTYNLSTGLRGNIELGFTKVASSVPGVSDQNVLLAKWQFGQETPTSPALAFWAIQRDLTDGASSTDYGLSATKILKPGGKPLVLDLGLRSTKALGLGLFGFSGDRKVKWEGSAALFVAPKFAIATEFKQQISADTWTDVAFRYVASDQLNLDAGIADLGPGLGNQIAIAVTWKQ